MLLIYYLIVSSKWISKKRNQRDNKFFSYLVTKFHNKNVYITNRGLTFHRCYLSFVETTS